MALRFFARAGQVLAALFAGAGLIGALAARDADLLVGGLASAVIVWAFADLAGLLPWRQDALVRLQRALATADATRGFSAADLDTQELARLRPTYFVAAALYLTAAAVILSLISETGAIARGVGPAGFVIVAVVTAAVAVVTVGAAAALRRLADSATLVSAWADALTGVRSTYPAPAWMAWLLARWPEMTRTGSGTLARASQVARSEGATPVRRPVSARGSAASGTDDPFAGASTGRTSRGRSSWSYTVPLSAAPSASAVTYGQVTPGTVFDVIEERDAFVRIRLDDGSEGWFPRAGVARAG